MSIFDDDDLEFREQARKEASQFKPKELCERNVQAIFNRCLAAKDTPDDKRLERCLFSRLRGYSPEVEKIVVFDKETALANEQNIKYLFGQLKSVHSHDTYLEINDAFVSYLNKNWTFNKGSLLELLYLGSIHPLLSVFDSKTNSSPLSTDILIPTLSPKDPNFPAWWEAHKSEWEVEA